MVFICRNAFCYVVTHFAKWWAMNGTWGIYLNSPQNQLSRYLELDYTLSVHTLLVSFSSSLYCQNIVSKFRRRKQPSVQKPHEQEHVSSPAQLPDIMAHYDTFWRCFKGFLCSQQCFSRSNVHCVFPLVSHWQLTVCWC